MLPNSPPDPQPQPPAPHRSELSNYAHDETTIVSIARKSITTPTHPTKASLRKNTPTTPVRNIAPIQKNSTTKRQSIISVSRSKTPEQKSLKGNSASISAQFLHLRHPAAPLQPKAHLHQKSSYADQGDSTAGEGGRRKNELRYYGYRYYDPVTGRWPSRDPIGENFSTKEFNGYAYINNFSYWDFDFLGLHGMKAGEPTITSEIPAPYSKDYITNNLNCASIALQDYTKWINEGEARKRLEGESEYTETQCEKPCPECTRKVWIMSVKDKKGNKNFHVIGHPSCPGGDSKNAVVKNGKGPVQLASVASQTPGVGQSPGGGQVVYRRKCYCKKIKK